MKPQNCKMKYEAVQFSRSFTVQRRFECRYYCTMYWGVRCSGWVLISNNYRWAWPCHNDRWQIAECSNWYLLSLSVWSDKWRIFKGQPKKSRNLGEISSSQLYQKYGFIYWDTWRVRVRTDHLRLDTGLNVSEKSPLTWDLHDIFQCDDMD